MNEATRASVTRILEMFLPDEERHFEESEKPDNHIYRDLLALQTYVATEPKLLEAAEGVLSSEDDTGCENCTVVDMEAIEELRTAVEATKPNAEPVPPQADSTDAG